MSELIRFEFNKLFFKKIVYVSLAAFGLLYIVMLYSWIFENGWAITQEGEMIYGMEATAYNEEIVTRYEGNLTDEKVQQILNEFARTDGTDTLDVSNSVYYPIANLFANRDGTWNGKTVDEVFPEFGRPPLLGNSSRWEAFLYGLAYILMIGGIITVIVLSPVFSEEYSSGMDALILTSQYGKTRCVNAKIAASFLFSMAYTGIILALAFLAFYIGTGYYGWDADIQLSEFLLYARIPNPIKCWQAAFWQVVLAVISSLTLTSLVLIISLVSKTPYVSIILAALVYLAPVMINPSSELFRRLVLLAPANLIQVSAVLGMKGFSLPGFHVPMIAAASLLMAAAILIIWFCGRRIFAKHQVL